MRIAGIPTYKDLDLTGEAMAAAERMEARAREPASERMFAELIEPLLPAQGRILEVGGGTGPLSRRMARARPDTQVFLTDKSRGMLSVAEALQRTPDAPRNLTIASWDVLDDASFPCGDQRFELIISSVMVPYLSDLQTEELVRRLSDRLTPGGALVFLEQDLLTDAVNVPSFDLFRRVFGRDERALKRTLALGLRAVLRDAGLELLPRQSFLWTDDRYGPYVSDLLGKIADDALKAGRINADERARWTRELETLAAAGDFYYGLVYHRVAGRTSSRGSPL